MFLFKKKNTRSLESRFDGARLSVKRGKIVHESRVTRFTYRMLKHWRFHRLATTNCLAIRQQHHFASLPNESVSDYLCYPNQIESTKSRTQVFNEYYSFDRLPIGWNSKVWNLKVAMSSDYAIPEAILSAECSQIVTHNGISARNQANAFPLNQKPSDDELCSCFEN